MKMRIQFYVEQEEYEIIEHEGKAKGLEVGDFCRMAVFGHIDKYKSKGVFAELHRIVKEKEEA